MTSAIDAAPTRCRFDLVDGRLVLVFHLDTLLPVTSIALLPVELSVFEGCCDDVEDSDGDGDGNIDDAVETQKQQLQQEVVSLFKGRFPFSTPPIPPPPQPPPLVHKSYMLMVGYKQVTCVILFCWIATCGV